VPDDDGCTSRDGQGLSGDLSGVGLVDRVLERDACRARRGDRAGVAEGNAARSDTVGVLTARTPCCATSWRQQCSGAAVLETIGEGFLLTWRRPGGEIWVGTGPLFPIASAVLGVIRRSITPSQGAMGLPRGAVGGGSGPQGGLDDDHLRQSRGLAAV